MLTGPTLAYRDGSEEADERAQERGGDDGEGVEVEEKDEREYSCVERHPRQQVTPSDKQEHEFNDVFTY